MKSIQYSEAYYDIFKSEKLSKIFQKCRQNYIDFEENRIICFNQK